MRLAACSWCKSCYCFLHPDHNPELWRLRLNFLVLVVFNFVQGIGETSTLSTFHQFITNPREQDLNNTESVTPGLGKTESFYSWTIATFSLGRVIAAVLVGFAVKWIPYCHLLLVGIVMHGLSSLLYATAMNGWMMAVSELLSGAYGGVVGTVAFAYIDAQAASYGRAYATKQQYESGESKALKRSRIKQKGYAVITFTEGISFLAGPGICALVVQIPGISPFRWVGWFNFTLDIVALLLLIGFFRGECQTSKCTKQTKRRNIKTLKTPKWSCSLSKAHIIKGTMLVWFLLATCTDSDQSGIETIVNPVLSDIFGLNKKMISYYFIGIMVMHVAGSLFMIVFNPEENTRINNRLLTIITLLISMIGCLLMADWQSIGSDPCLQYSLFHNPNIDSSIIQSKDRDTIAIPDLTVTVEPETLGAREQCLHSPDNCYWNQYSPLTKVECLGCPPICRGVYKSLNFLLFSVGVAVSAFVIPITEVVWTVLITDNLGDDTVEKGPMMGLIVGAEGLAGVISPLWMDALYEVVGKRTFLAMIVDFLLGVPVLIGLILFFKHLQPEDHRYTELSHSSDSDSSSSLSSLSSSSSESDVENGLEAKLMFTQAKEKEENLAVLSGIMNEATTRV